MLGFGSSEEAFLKVVGHMLGSKSIAGRRLWSDLGFKLENDRECQCKDAGTSRTNLQSK